jgi:hypothetical protein
LGDCERMPQARGAATSGQRYQGRDFNSCLQTVRLTLCLLKTSNWHVNWVLFDDQQHLIHKRQRCWKVCDLSSFVVAWTLPLWAWMAGLAACKQHVPGTLPYRFNGSAPLYIHSLVNKPLNWARAYTQSAGTEAGALQALTARLLVPVAVDSRWTHYQTCRSCMPVTAQCVRLCARVCQPCSYFWFKTPWIAVCAC